MGANDANEQPTPAPNSTRAEAEEPGHPEEMHQQTVEL